MPTKQTVQYLLGYVCGGLLFLILIPRGLYRAAQIFDRRLGRQLLPLKSLRLTLAGGLALSGLVFAVWSLVVQYTRGHGGPLEIAGLEVSPKTRQLVVSGPYRYTRNPMLFGTCAYYYAVALYLNSISAATLVAGFMTGMLIWVKLTEERRLLQEFGEQYERYRQRVALFIPWLPKHQP